MTHPTLEPTPREERDIADDVVARRLFDLGFMPGEPVTRLRKAPLGDPIEISIRNFTLTLRKAEAAILELEAV